MTTSPDWRCTTCGSHYHCAVATAPPRRCDRCGGESFRAQGDALAGLRRAQGWEREVLAAPRM